MLYLVISLLLGQAASLYWLFHWRGRAASYREAQLKAESETSRAMSELTVMVETIKAIRSEATKRDMLIAERDNRIAELVSALALSNDPGRIGELVRSELRRPMSAGTGTAGTTGLKPDPKPAT